MISERKNGREWWEDDPLAAFESFDLDASFGDGKSAIFRKSDGQPGWKVDIDGHERPDVSRLAVLAKRAIERLLAVVHIEGGARPAELVAYFLKEAEELRASVVDHVRNNFQHVQFREAGSEREIVFAEGVKWLEDHSTGPLLLMLAKMFGPDAIRNPKHSVNASWVAMLCSGCLREIDYALRALDWECDDSTAHTVCAMECLTLADNICESEDARERLVSEWGRKARSKALESDPKQAQKLRVKECWQAWRADKRRYASKAAFARDMLQKFPDLTSTKVIEDWCRAWEKLEVNP